MWIAGTKPLSKFLDEITQVFRPLARSGRFFEEFAQGIWQELIFKVLQLHHFIQYVLPI